MNNYKFSTISHRDLVYANPIGPAKMETVIDRLELEPQAQVVDFGAGSAELLIRLVERYGVKATGIDQIPDFVQKGQEQAAKRITPDKLHLIATKVEDAHFQEQYFDLAICIGATIIFGDYKGTLRSLARYLKPGGLMLVGELYWKKEPTEDYLAAFGLAREEYRDYPTNIKLGIEQGLTPFYATVANQDEWDHYEWTRIGAIERYVREQPDDPDGQALQNRIRAWRDLYLNGGRDTLGFGLYLFQK